MSVKENPVVGIAVHSYGPVPPVIYANHIGIFSFWAKNCSCKFLHIDGVKTAEARNMLVKLARDKGCDYIMFLDADHIVDEFLLPCLLGNMETAAVASGLIVKRDGKGEQIGFFERTDGKYYSINLPLDGLTYAVDKCAFGCTMIDLSVFNDMEEPYFRDEMKDVPGKGLTQNRSDMVFCEHIKAQGKTIVVNTRAVVGHVGCPVIHYPEDVQYQLATYDKALEFIKEDSVVADFGCGSGRKLVEKIEPIANGITGIDKHTRGPKLRYPESKVNWVDEDFDEGESLWHGNFDVIICADVLEHLKHPEKIIKQMLACLEKNGKIIISTPDCTTTDDINLKINVDHKQFWDEESFKSLLLGNGLFISEFTREKEVTAYYSMIAVCEKFDHAD